MTKDAVSKLAQDRNLPLDEKERNSSKWVVEEHNFRCTISFDGGGSGGEGQESLHYRLTKAYSCTRQFQRSYGDSVLSAQGFVNQHVGDLLRHCYAIGAHLQNLRTDGVE